MPGSAAAARNSAATPIPGTHASCSPKNTSVPPPCAGLFIDVPCPPTPADPYADWVELLFHDGITAGCNAAGDPPAFCPNREIPNQQMAVFLVKAFGIPYLP